jgi:hypothetical protein
MYRGNSPLDGFGAVFRRDLENEAGRIIAFTRINKFTGDSAEQRRHHPVNNGSSEEEPKKSQGVCHRTGLMYQLSPNAKFYHVPRRVAIFLIQ